MINYVEKNLKTFDTYALNEVDALILTWVSYFHINEKIYKKGSFDTIPIKELYNAEFFDSMLFDVFDIPSSKKLISLLAANPRFRDIEIVYYDENTNRTLEKQFSAMTFKFDKDKYFVAFRGTDHSFVGWKEDLNMSFLKNIPSQIAAKEYLNKVMAKYRGSYYIGGHSKGGNLAMYASSFMDNKYKDRVITLYNFDGPNLNSRLTKTEDFKSIKNKIKKFVPQSSVVGMCFEKTTNYKIIKSNGIGVLQHNPFTWEIKDKKLKVLKNTTFDSKVFKNGINALIDDLSDEELKLFADSIYNVINATNTNTVEDFLKQLNKNIPVVLKGINKFDDKQKALMKKVADIYIKEAFNNFIPNLNNVFSNKK